LKMKNTREVAGESSKKRRKTAEDEADEDDETMSPVTTNTGHRGGSQDRHLRRQYSSELGEESPEQVKSWRPSSRPREGGYRIRDADWTDRPHGLQYEGRGRHAFYGREQPGRYGQDFPPYSHSPPRYSRGGGERFGDSHWGSRGRADRFRENISPPFHPRQQRGRQHLEYYDSRLERSPAPSTSRAHRVFHDVKPEKEEPNKVQLDMKGEPTGKYADLFRVNIVSFSKELDPGPNWEGQTQDARDRLQERIRNEWGFTGEAKRLSEKWLKSEVGKALINFCHRIGKLIDAGDPKPPELKKEFWENLAKKRGSKDWKNLFETMVNVAKYRGVRNKTRVRIEKSELIRLVSIIVSLTSCITDVMMVLHRGW
jgi:hypothetical protein